MLSYQHIYHAGNFADVHKHVILAQILKTLAARPQTMAVLDMHAGRGLYALDDAEAARNREYDNGIAAFWDRREHLPAVFRPYMDIVSRLNPDGALKTYPGSAWIAREMLRPGEKLTAVERHPGEFRHLKAAFAGRPHAELLQDDSFKVLSGRVPFPARRGLVICDPSYEIKTEYADVAKHIHAAWKKWPQGCYALWYPCMAAGGHTRLLTGLAAQGVRDVLVSEIALEAPPEAHFRMQGSGMAVINPPWPETVLREVTQAVATRLPAAASGRVFWLDNCPVDPLTGMAVI